MSAFDPQRAGPARLAVLASGQGSTFAALVHAGRQGVMPVEVVLLITSRADAPAGQLAEELGSSTSRSMTDGSALRSATER